MSNSLIDHSPDLKALTDAGYPLEVRGAYLVVKDVPYLKDAAGGLARADMVMSIEFPEGTATPPGDDHTVWWTGKPPFRADGSSMEDYLSCGVLSPTLFDAGFPRLFDVNPARIFLIVRSFPDRCVGAHGLCARFRLAVRLRFGLVLEES